jgi:hypothetical protein
VSSAMPGGAAARISANRTSREVFMALSYYYPS